MTTTTTPPVPPLAAPPTEPVIRRHHSFLQVASRYAIVLVFTAMLLVLALLSSSFFTSRNLLNVLSQNAPIGIVACGAVLVIIAGGFDLSVGAIFGFSGIIAAMAANATSTPTGLIIGALVGLGLGMVNGLVITLFGIDSFIATLASGLVFAGFAEVLTGGTLVSVTAGSFTILGNRRVGGVPLPVLGFAVVAAISGLVLARSRFGRYIYAAGSNAEAARLSGIRVELVRIGTFAVSGLCAGIAGVISVSRIGSAQANAGSGIQLTVIAAVVVGGVSISGGEGAVWRGVLGVLLIALIGNGFNIVNIDPFFQSIAQGLIILLAVAFDSRSAGSLQRYSARMRVLASGTFWVLLRTIRNPV